ncbi:MAG: flagellar basal body-associated FliL family protein [Desulfovibrionaceae bacterium]|nr:flagellar basal body-associated FliL family protein [Desulfovibrionaceae bacterium]
MSQTTETAVQENEAAPQVEVAQETQDNLPAEATSKNVGKVELDIDDAPFLKEEPKTEEKAEGENLPAEGEPDQAKKKKKKKLLILIAGGAVVLIALGVAAFFFLSGPPASPPPPPPEEVKPNIIVVPSKPTVQAIPDVVRDFEPFIVPVGSSTATTNFLVCKFSAVAKSPAINTEIDHKMLVLRDAVYFYLRGKPAEYLLDSANAPAVKRDLVDILNGYLQRGKLQDVLLDSYLAH